jgi:GNAT superfamily N-acetyltransferase
MIKSRHNILVRNTCVCDFPYIAELSGIVYQLSLPWSERQLSSHLKVFPEGQFVAFDEDLGRVVGMASSLIIHWEDYNIKESWCDFTDNGMFTNHDPLHGRTLYGADIMVHPSYQGRGIGGMLYKARRALVESLALLRIRAGGRLRGYYRYADRLTAEEYVIKVICGEITDPTLSFQLKQGFYVLDVVSGYLPEDPDSLGYAAVIEWINKLVAKPADYAGRDATLASIFAAHKI